MLLAGIDPGKKGAVVIVYYNEITGEVEIEDIADMQLVKEASKEILNLKWLTDLLFAHTPDKIFLEKVSPSPSSGSAVSFDFGKMAGMIKGLIWGIGMDLEEITPQKWKSFHGLIKKDKSASRERVLKYFPKKKDFFYLVKHTDRAEAALIALAGIRKSL